MESSGFYLVDAEFNIVSMNDTAKSIYPQLEVGKKCYTCLMGLDSPCPPCPIVNGVKGPRTYVDPIRKLSETVDAVDVPHGEAGMCHALVFSTVGSTAQLAATLPTSSEELEKLALVKALTVRFDDVFAVNLPTENITLYRHNGKTADADSLYKYNMQYNDGIKSYITRYVHPDERDRLFSELSIERIREKLRLSEQYNVHYRTVSNNHYVHSIARIGSPGDFENFVVGVACEDDIVRAHQRSSELEKRLGIIETDTLTGLYTKEAFILNGSKLMESNPGKSYDLCILRFENLDLINHQQGEQTGEKILQIISGQLKTYIDSTNCIGYMGNGCFASVTETYDSSSRRNNIRTFRDKIFENSPVKNLSLKWSLYKSIERDSSLSEIYEKTMFALSSIRSSIHEEYVEFDKTIFNRFEFEQSIEKDFDRALANNEFVLYFQPKYSVKTGKIAGAEALVRWINREGTLISPAKFIPVLERCGKINVLDTYVFARTCALMKKLSSEGLKTVPVSVNLSRASIFTEDIVGIFERTAANYGIRPELVPIEITESAAVRASSIYSFTEEFISRGFKLHMDDFGSGYSSLVSLTAIPFEIIKLDKTLIDYIGKNSNENLLKHITAYAHEQGMRVVAEGVESYEQYYFLKVIGCDEIQGYYFSKPLAEEEYVEKLRKES